MKIIIKKKTGFLLRRAFLYLSFLCTFFCIADVSAQKQSLSTRSLTVKEGLPQGYVSGIAQDKAGYIWIGTRNGLARYDGKKFKVFYHDAADTSSIAGNLLTNIFIDSRDRLWINYEGGGLDIFYPETEKINHISNRLGLEVLKMLTIEADGISEDAEGNILLNAFAHSLIKVTLNNQLQYPLQKLIPKEEILLGINQNKNHQLYILTNKFLYHLNGQQQIVQKSTFDIPLSLAKSVEGRYGIFPVSDTTLIISGINSFVKYRVNNSRYEAAAILPTVNKVRGSSTYQLMYFNNEEATFSTPGKDAVYTFATKSTANISCLLDRSGVLWIGTNGYGVQLVHLRHTSFQYHKYTPPFTSFIIQKYLGLKSNVPPNLATDDNIYSLRWAYDKAGTLWMSNRRDYDKDPLPVYAYANQQFTRPNWQMSNSKAATRGTIYGIAIDSKNDLWVLQSEFRISKLSPATGGVQTFSPIVPAGIRDIDISLLVDKQDNFWVASNFGLLHYRAGMKTYNLFSPDSKNIFNQATNRIINLAEDHFDTDKLWMGTLGNGLICFNKKDKAFTFYTKKGGLPDNTIYSVVVDDHGYLWCTTNQGIFRFDTRANKVRKYADENGAPDFEFNRFHHFRLPDGRFVFAGFEDYTVFDPLSFTEDSSNLNVAITSWKINNQPADYGEAASPLKQVVNSLGEVRLNHLQNFLTFEFAALQYDHPEIFEYRYKLSGINKDWVYNGTSNLINYTALPPGIYDLSINAANASGVWSNKIKQLRIIIEPPWWRTWWFYTLIFITAVSLMYGFYRYRLNQVLKIQRVRNRIAKDLHDEIGSTLSTISIYAKVVQQQLKGTGENANPLLTKISNNANQVQDAMNDIVWSINTKNDDLQNIINRMREHAIELFEAKDYILHFSFDETLNTVTLNMEQRKDFYLIYKEALNNIAKYADGKNIWITLTEKNGHIALTIKDDGKGFDVSSQSHGGNGLHNMQSRAQALKGELSILSDKEGGTTVSLVFKN